MVATLIISTENEDDFVRNLAIFLVEERCGLTVRRPQAFIYVTVAAASGPMAQAQTGACGLLYLGPHGFKKILGRRHEPSP